MMSATVARIPMQNGAKRNLVIAALGVVFGDIGTSPLYTMRACFGGSHGMAVEPLNVLGMLSLIFWALLFVVSLKYVMLIMRADNRGEGGIMALLALIQQKADLPCRLRNVVIGLGLFGTALFYGDGVIAPAISVLSAVEGLEVLKPEFHHYVVPLALALLLALFSRQGRGLGSAAYRFGPIMLVWFGCLGFFGIHAVLRRPEVLAAVNPLFAFEFFARHGIAALFTLGGVVLAVTGCEALYADMGHFGRRPIRRAWFLLVLPALLANYFGQGALLLSNPEAIRSPFFLLVPASGLTAMILLATVAALIASQAIIGGAFALTVQAIQLGFCPRLTIRHDLTEEGSQVYLPWINWALFAGVAGLVAGFQSAGALAAAYGIAVTGTMALTSILGYFVISRIWKWPAWVSIGFLVPFLTVDLALFLANTTKFPDGGWFPILAATLIVLLLTTWTRGRKLVLEKLAETVSPLEEFLRRVETERPVRVPGTAIFLTAHADGIPPALSQNLEHNKVLHQTVVLMTIVTENVPRVLPEKRREVVRLADDLFRVTLRYGFMEQPNLPRVLMSCRDFDIDLRDTTFFLSRESIIAQPSPRMPLWRLKLFTAMTRNTSNAANYFQIPCERVVELGTQLVL